MAAHRRPNSVAILTGDFNVFDGTENSEALRSLSLFLSLSISRYLSIYEYIYLSIYLSFLILII